MSASVVLADASLEVVPGEVLTVRAVIANTGTVVDAIVLDVVGLPEGWARVEPPEVRLLPGRKREVDLVVAPPRESGTEVGLSVLGLRAACREDPDGGCVEEAVLEVRPFVDVAAELVPRSRTARGRRRASFVVAVDNRGNAPLTVTLDAYDPDQDLALAVGQSQVECPAGGAVFGTLLVRGQRTYWRGPALAKGFVVLVQVPGAADPISLPGTLNHTALLPQALPRLLGRALLLGLGLLALLLLVQPRVSPGGEAASEVAVVQEATPPPLDETTLEAAADADVARRTEEDITARTGVAPTSAAPAPARAAAPAARPYTARLQVRATDSGPFLRVGRDEALSVAGFVLQPNGDRGEMTVLRDGTALLSARLGDTQVFTLPAPVAFGPSSTLQFTVLCRNPEGDACDAALLVTGSVRTVPVPTPEPSPGPVAPAPAAAPQPARTAQPLPTPSSTTPASPAGAPGT